MCDNCDEWFHADCQGIGNSAFDILGQSKATWHCNRCKFPNYTHGLFESLDTLSDTSELSLLIDSTYHPSRSDLLDSRSPKPPDTPGPPQATSSPKVPIVNKVKQGWDNYCPAGKFQWKMPEKAGTANTPKITEVANTGIFEQNYVKSLLFRCVRST